MNPCAYEYPSFLRKGFRRLPIGEYPFVLILLLFIQFQSLQSLLLRRLNLSVAGKYNEVYRQAHARVSYHIPFEVNILLIANLASLVQQPIVIFNCPRRRKGKEHLLFRIELIPKGKLQASFRIDLRLALLRTMLPGEMGSLIFLHCESSSVL